MTQDLELPKTTSLFNLQFTFPFHDSMSGEEHPSIHVLKNPQPLGRNERCSPWDCLLVTQGRFLQVSTTLRKGLSIRD